MFLNKVEGCRFSNYKMLSGSPFLRAPGSAHTSAIFILSNIKISEIIYFSIIKTERYQVPVAEGDTLHLSV